jgi:UDP-glucose 4-epimerase
LNFLNQNYKVVVTGGSGFFGSHLLKHEAFQEALVIGRTPLINHEHFESISFNDIDSLSKVLNNVEIVVHLAGRAHIMNETATRPLDVYRNTNTVGTLNLAKQAALAGVKRFIFISSIKVLGEKTTPDKPFNNNNSLNPQDPYSVSKAEAEIGLRDIGNNSGMDIVIIRPPLIYGAGVKGNFSSLLKFVRLPLPLPLGSIENKRSFVSAENLVDLVVTCLHHPNAKNKSFLVSDDKDLSTPELLSMIAEAGGYKSCIFKCPQIFLASLLRLLGKSEIYDRLCDSMQVEIEYTKKQLGWKPPFKVKDSLSGCWQSNKIKVKGQYK